LFSGLIESSDEPEHEDAPVAGGVSLSQRVALLEELVAELRLEIDALKDRPA
jgi:uncharacterized protein YceH (UPF0502 family)